MGTARIAAYSTTASTLTGPELGTGAAQAATNDEMMQMALSFMIEDSGLALGEGYLVDEDGNLINNVC